MTAVNPILQTSKLRFGDVVTCPKLHSESTVESGPKLERTDFQSTVGNNNETAARRGLSARFVTGTAKHFFPQVGQHGSSGRTPTAHPAPLNYMAHPVPLNYMLLVVDITTLSLFRCLGQGLLCCWPAVLSSPLSP